MRWLLLVEDRAFLREGLALLLKWQTGFESIQAKSLAEARRILSETKDEPVCVVVDLDLPNGDGMELLEQLRGLPVIALAANRSLQCRARALEAGADEVLPTADSPNKLIGTVKRLVNG